MRRFTSLAKVLCAASVLSLTTIAGAQTPVALPYTTTTVVGGLASRTTYTAGTTICPGTSATKASTAEGDNCAAVSGIIGSGARGGIAVDQYGNIFTADDVDKAVHMIDVNTGTMTVVAGLGTVCATTAGKLDSAGDGCLGSTGTSLGAVRGMGLDAYGNVLIGDYGDGFIHIVCRYASPLCATGTPAPTASNPLQVAIGYMGIVAGCAPAAGSAGTAGVGIDGTPGFSTVNSTATNTASYPLNLSGSKSAFKNSAACTTSLGTVESPRAAWGDIYGNVYYADTASSRTRVVLGPYTSSYFSGANPLYTALEVDTNWTYSTSGGLPTGALKPGYVYTIANVQGLSASTSTPAVAAGSSCGTQITGDSVTYQNASITSTAIDTHADGCPFFDSSVTASSGYTDTDTTDAAGNLIFTDPNNNTGLLRVFFVQGWASNSAATSAGASGSVASAGVAMYNAILKNNPGITPTPGYIYALAGGAGVGQTGFTSKALTTAPSLGNATTIASGSITKIAVSPQGNIYIGNNTSVLFYDLYNGTIRTLLTAGSGTASTTGTFCTGNSGAVARSTYFDGCPISLVGWGTNGQAAGNLGIGVDAQGDVYIEDSVPALTVIRKVLAQGMGVASTGTLNALASSSSTAYPLQSLGTQQTQTFMVHFPAATGQSATLTNSTSPNFSFGTPSCTWYSSVDNSMDCTVTATYTPTAAGPQSAQVTLAAAGGETFTLNLGSTVAGSVLATDNATSAGSNVLNTAQLFNGNTPYAVATDGGGNVYAAISSNSSYAIVESLAASPSSLVTLASGLSARPTALAVDQTGNVFYLQSGSSAIQELPVAAAGSPNTYGAVTTLAYIPANLGTANPTALAVNAAGNILVADEQGGAGTIYEVSPSAFATLTQATCDLAFAAGPILPSLCQAPVSNTNAFGAVSAVAAGPSGNIYVADTTNNAVYELTPGVSTSGIYTYTESTLASATAYGLTADAAGDVYALGSSGVTMYPVSGPASVSVYGVASSPLGVAVDGTGNVYVADSGYSYVTQVQRGGVTQDFGSNYTTEFAATLTNAGNLASAAQSSGNGSQAPLFNIAGGGSNGCAFSGSNLLQPITAGQACTMTATFPAIGDGEEIDNIIFGLTSPATSQQGALTLKGLADLPGFNTTVTIGAASTATNTPVYSPGAEVSYPITVTANGTSTDGKTTITSGPTTSNFVYVSVDGKPQVQYNFTSTNGLNASFTLTLSGLDATTTPATQHSFLVNFPQQGSFLASSNTQGSIAINQQPTILNWTPGSASQQVSAPIGSSVLNATITTSVAGQIAYAYGAYPSCTSASAAPGSTPIDASTYLPLGSYTLFAIFCPTDAIDYASSGNSFSYSVTQASTVTAVGASTMVVAPSGGNFTSVSAALAALPTSGGTIYIAPGFYYGQNVISYPNVSLRGLGGDATKVVLTAEDGAFSSPYAGYLGTGTGAGNASAQGDQGSSTLDVSKSVYMGQTAGSTSSPIGVTNSTQNTPVNFYAEYMTVQNTWDTDNFTKTTFQVSGSNCVGGFTATALSTLFNAGTECAGQALALWIAADQAVLNNVNLTSLQDTLYAGSQGASGSSRTPARQYMWKGTITGNVDYVFGDAAMVFDHTNFFTAWHGSATGTETIEAQNKGDQTGSSTDYLSGYICNSCTLLSQSTGMTNLLYGRPYGAYSTWIMLNSRVDQVNAAGWIEFSGATNLPTSTYAEFNSVPYTDPPVGTAPYPAGLFFENSTIIPGYTGTPGYTVTPTGGNTGAGVTGTREVTSQDPGTLEAANAIKTQLTTGEATQYAPQAFLSTTVPLQTYYGFSQGWNPQAVLATQVNAFVPSTVINPIAFGSSVTILGRPQTPGAGVIPTGTYQFLDGGTVIASGNLDASGEAYFTSSALTTGTHNITMVYGGDANFTGSTSGIYPVKVLPSGVPTTTTTLSVADISATLGRPITGTVSVSPAAAPGAATIYLDGASATMCALSSGACSWSLSSVSVGSHSIYAAYSGSGSYGASNSTTTTVNVAPATATGDIRGVTEPSFPAVCTTLTAALTTDPAIQDLDASVDANNSNIDGARIQAAINSCAGTGHAVELSMDATGAHNAFLSGPLSLPSNVTLLVDPNVTVYFSRNVQDYDTTPGTHTCGTIAQTGGCTPLISIPKASTNVAIMGYGKLNGRGGDVLINAFPTSGCTYPVTPTPSWWDLAAAYTSPCGQENPIFIDMAGGASTNITLYKITLLNAPTFHIGSASQVTGLTIWDIKISTPSYARNTDGIDPGDVSNLTIANSWVSDGDDNVALAGVHYLSQNDSVINNHFYAGHGESIGSYTGAGLNNVLFDGNMSAGNAFAGGSAISAAPATVDGTTYGAGYTDGNSTSIRIKTANDRGGLVNNVQYSNSCFLNHKIDVLFTPYYDAGDSTNEFPNYPHILMQNLAFLNTASSSGSVEMTGEYNTNNGSPVDNPVTVTLDNVTFPSALSSLTNSTTPYESSATSSTWGSNYSGGTGQYANLTLGPGQVSSNFINAFVGLATVPANNDTLTDNISQPALDPPNCVFTYIAPELTGPTGLPQTVPYGSTANLDVILLPIVSGSAYPTGSFTVNDTTTSQSFTSALTTTTDTHVVTIPVSDLTIGTHTFTVTYLGDSNYTIPASYQTFGSYNVTVVQAPQTITFGAIPTQAPGTQLTLTATASSGLSVGYVSNTTSVCTVSGSTATFLQAGICSITASQPGNTNYLAATPVTQSVSVVTAPTWTFTTAATVSGSHSAGYTMTITIKNTGTATASNLALSAATLGTTSGTPLPQTWGTLTAGATATFTVTLPGSAGLDGAGVAEKYTATFTGGSVTTNIRSVTLP